MWTTEVFSTAVRTCVIAKSVQQALFLLSWQRGQKMPRALACGQLPSCARTIPSFKHRVACPVFFSQKCLLAFSGKRWQLLIW